MARKIPNLTLEEIPGNEVSALDAVQRAALPLISANLQTVIRDLLARGVLVETNGKIIPNS